MTTAVPPDTGHQLDIAGIQQRTLRSLWASSVFSRGAVSSIFPVGVLAIKELLGSDTWAGLSTGATTVGAAAAAAVLATFMQRHGRNLGLSAGFAVALVGAVVSIFGIESESLPIFIAGMVLVGAGSGTSTLSRYAASDLATEERRSRDISSVIFASTFGAVLFPLFIGFAGNIAEDWGLNEFTGGYIMGAICFVIAGLAIFLFMRPDPLVVAGGVVGKGDATERKKATPFAQAVAIAWAHPLARLAFVALVISQAVMVMVMAMTPLHMKAHDHETGIIGAVISAHTAGMFAFAPVAGWLSDRYGRLQMIVASGLTLAIATVLTALAGEAPMLLMFPGLFLLGLGWSFGIVAASALLTESVAPEDQVAVQGAADTAKSIASGAGAIASGLVLDMAGYHILSILGMLAAAAMLGHSWFENKVTAAI